MCIRDSHRAQLEAERFESPFLETWHVLLAMVEVPGSVAYLTFTDFEDRIHSEEIETAAVLAMEKRPKDLSESDIIDLRAQSPALELSLIHIYCKEWLSVGKIKVIHDRNTFKKWVLV